MKENLHSRDTEGVSPQLCAARSKHLYVLPSLSLRQLENPVAWKNPALTEPFLPSSSKCSAEYRKKNQNMLLFYFQCQEILQARYHFGEQQITLQPAWDSIPVNEFPSQLCGCPISGPVVRRKPQSQPWHWHVTVTFLSPSAVFCLPLAEV